MAKLYVFVENKKTWRSLMETLGNWGYRWGDGNFPSDIPEPQILTLYGSEREIYRSLTEEELREKLSFFMRKACPGEFLIGKTEISAAKFLWSVFGDIPMDPETECIELPWIHFEAGTFREDIWHWFEDVFHVSVAEDLMGMGGEK